MKTWLYAAAALLCLTPAVSPAQTEDEIELTRTVVEAERKVIVAANMGMTEAESKAFWPVFNDYQGDMRKISDRRIALIKAYAESYQTFTDEQAAKILEEYLDIEDAYLKLRKSYVKKVGKVLSPKLVTRFFQIENKLQAVVDFDLARNIPLAK